MRTSSLRRRVVGAGVALSLVGSLVPVVAAPVAAGSSVFVGTQLVIPRGGTSSGTAGIQFSESAVNEFPAGGFTLIVNIAPSAGPATDVSFVTTTAPTLVKPDSIAATVAFTGPQQFTVTATATSTTQVESFTVQGLRVSATAGAAVGDLVVTYVGIGLPAGIFDLHQTAAATIIGAGAGAGATAIPIQLDPGSPTFIGGQASVGVGLGTAETATITSTSASTLNLAAGLTFAHAAGERVTQTQVIPGRLPSIGTIPTTTPQISVTALSKPTIVRGAANQLVGNIVISETSGDPLVAGETIHVLVATDPALGLPGATFSSAPTVTPNTATSGMTAAIANATASGFDIVIGAAPTLALGSLTISNIRLTVAANASAGDLYLNLANAGVGAAINTGVAVATVTTSAATTLTLTSLSGSSVPVSGTATLSAVMYPAVAGQAVVFQARPAGSSIFATIGTVLTDASGAANLLVAVPVNTTYQAVFAGSASLSSATSLPLAISAMPAVNLRIAGGYKTALTTTFSTAVLVSNKRYVTLRATLTPAMSNVAVQFWMREGRYGEWVRVTTGRTDASGVCVWSRVITTPAGATGYDRYVYFKAFVPATAQYGAASSNSVRGVVRYH